MSTAFRAVLFDLDGTLVDTAADFVRAANALRAARGWQALPVERIAEQVSNGALAVTSVTFDIDEHHDEFAARRQELLDAYEQHLGAGALLYPTLENLLSQLQSMGVPWGIVTNKPVQYAAPLIEKLGIAEFCGSLVCPDHVTERKPHPEGLLLAAEQLGTAPEQCIYAGDHLRDIEAGRAAGMHTVAAAFGYLAPGDQASSWHADASADTPEALSRFILHKVRK